MSDDQNPYASSNAPSFDMPIPKESFGQAVSRGIGAAHKTLIGAMLVFVILAPIQITSTMSAALVAKEGVFEPPAQGQPPSPEIFAMIGMGCFICIWFPVILFAIPWVSGGIVGQIADRVAGKPADAFSAYGRQFYVRMLLLTFLYFAAIFVLMIPVWITGAVLGAGEMQAGQFDPVKMRELGRHPVNVAVGVLFGLALTAMSVLMILVQSNLVMRDCRTMEAISGGFRCISNHFGDTFKLFLVFILLSLPIVAVQQVPNFLTTVTIPVMAVVGLLSAIYLAYVSVLNPGIGLSVYRSRMAQSEGAP